jgi:uncharacterized alpha-E superfamily protein
MKIQQLKLWGSEQKANYQKRSKALATVAAQQLFQHRKNVKRDFATVAANTPKNVKSICNCCSKATVAAKQLLQHSNCH